MGMEIRTFALVALLLLTSCRTRREERRSVEWLRGYEARRAETIQTQQASAVHTSAAVWERVVMERDTSGDLVVTQRVVERYEAADTSAADSQLFRREIAVDSVSAEKGMVTQERNDLRPAAVKTASALLALFLLAAMLAVVVSLYSKIKRRL